MRKSNSIIFAALAGTFLLSAETAAWFNGTSYNNFSQSGVGPFRKIANVLSYGTALNYFNIIPTSITTSGGLTQASYTTSNSTNPIKYTTQANPYPFVLGSASVPVHRKKTNEERRVTESRAARKRETYSMCVLSINSKYLNIFLQSFTTTITTYPILQLVGLQLVPTVGRYMNWCCPTSTIAIG